jgi:hypothetical protein
MVVVREAPARDGRLTLVRAVAGAGVTAVLAGAVLLGAMHVVAPSSSVSPVRRTISEYALLANGWMFDTAVLLLAAGSLAVVAALVLAGVLRVGSGAVLGLVLWCAGLAAVVYFEKHDWSVGPSRSGHLHRLASVVAFLSLPVGALCAARRGRRDRRWRGPARVVAGFAVLALLCFAPIVVAFVAQPYTGVPWWAAIPLGAVERALGLSEIATVLALGWWAVRAAAPGSTDRDRLRRPT